MSSRTIYLSRLIGLYCILIVVSLVFNKQGTVDAITGLFNNPPLMLLMSIVTVAGGLALVLAHNVWKGGAQPVVVTLVGWAALLKGLMFLVLPVSADAEIILTWLRHPVLFYVSMMPSLLIGIYLTYEGFRPRAKA